MEYTIGSNRTEERPSGFGWTTRQFTSVAI